MAHPLTFDKDGNVIGQLPLLMTANEIFESHEILDGVPRGGGIVLATRADPDGKLYVLSGVGRLRGAYESGSDRLLPVSFE